MAGGISPSGIFPSGIFPSGIFPHITENVTLIYPIISYNEENEMFQIVGTSKAHPFQIRSLTTGDLATTCTGTVTVTVRTFTAGGTVSTDTTTLTSSAISAYNNDMTTFYISVPASMAITSYDSLEINVSCSEGEGFLMINIVPNPSSYGATPQEVWEYSTRTITGGSATGSGSEKIIPAANYTLDAAAKTITLTSPYDNTTLEQILEIRNITKGKTVIYDSKRAGSVITIADGVISWTPDFKYQGLAFEDTDVIQILVNKV